VGKPNKTPSLEEPFLTVIAHLKMETTRVLAKSSTLFVYKKNAKSIKEGL